MRFGANRSKIRLGFKLIVLLYCCVGDTVGLRLPDVPSPPQEQPLSPDFVGLATWYGSAAHSGRPTRSGEAYDPHALACAVPSERWRELAGKLLRIQRLDSDNYLLVRVNDSGLLSEAGRFSWGVRRVGEYNVARWWPDEKGLPVVVDLTPIAHRYLSLDGNTVPVRVWILAPA